MSLGSDSSDEWLKQHLSKRKYDELNSVIFRSVPKMYLNEMQEICPNLIENAKVLGHVYKEDSNSDDENDEMQDPTKSTERLIKKNKKIPKKDLSTVSDADLFMSIVELEQAIILQRKENEKLLQEIQLLDPAMRQLDLEKQGLFTELMNIERSIQSI